MSTGFGFGGKTTAPPTFGTGSITFGTPATQPAQQFGFGNLSSSAPNLFGTQSTPTTSALGFKPSGFGAPAIQPSGGYSFGASTPSFGNPVSTAPSAGFGLATPAASSGLTFGTPAASTSLAFGTPAASTGLTFGTPTTSGGLAFGTPAATTGLSFGTPVATTGLSFGTPASSAPSTGLAFKPAGSTGLAFGTPASSAPSFGTASTGFGTGTAAPSTGLAFGVASSAPATGLSFGTTTSAPTLGSSFGAPSTSAPGASFGLTSAGGGFGFGGGGAPGLGVGGSVTSSAAHSLGLTAATAAPQQNVGLGGVPSTQSKGGSGAAAQKELPPKEQLLPNEFAHLVEQFKNVVQEEKNRSSDVARCSVKEFRKVETELDSLNHQFNQVENQLLNNRNLAEQLKYDTAKGLQHVEMAQRTQDTPPSLQYDNTAPLQFFLDLADNFEREMQILKLKIDNTEKFVKKCNEPNLLTSQDLALGLRRLHETFVALAGRMQSVHSQVEAQKEVFLSLRKQAIKDNINPFEKMDKSAEAMNLVMRHAMRAAPPALASGPTPFNSVALESNNLTLAAPQTQPPPYPAATTMGPTGIGKN
ncbi:nuclear pore complex protein Nup58-like isoform X2 [Tenebrio molitor]|uniref:nuclear pore complex protein Nup58-like isoform X2 n=1 Tax=Tenebrio molitor TaxID=7067 RepID=UPI003624928E